MSQEKNNKEFEDGLIKASFDPYNSEIQSAIDKKKENEKRELDREEKFDSELHDLIIKVVTEDSNTNRTWKTCFRRQRKDKLEQRFNQILPAIRIQYLREWKKAIVGTVGNYDNIEDRKKKSEMIAGIVKQFDEILKEQQKREQRADVLWKLLWFFGFETVLVFVLLIFIGLDILRLAPVTIDIIVGATIVQVAGMLTTVVFHLYPPERETDDKIIDRLDKLNNLRNKLIKSSSTKGAVDKSDDISTEDTVEPPKKQSRKSTKT